MHEIKRIEALANRITDSVETAEMSEAVRELMEFKALVLLEAGISHRQ